MTAQLETRPWDFSEVLKLAHTLDQKNEPRNDSRRVQHVPVFSGISILYQRSYGSNSANPESDGIGLGDLAKVWQYLGARPSTPAQEPPAQDDANEATEHYTSKEHYASDGAAYCQPPSVYRKTVQFREDSSSEGTAQNGSDQGASSEVKLSKAQRKKRRRRERKVQEELQAKKMATVSESEAEPTARKTPAGAASAHAVLNRAEKRYDLRQRDASGHVTISTSEQDQTLTKSAGSTIATPPRKPINVQSLQTFVSQLGEKPRTTPMPVNTARQHSMPVKVPAVKTKNISTPQPNKAKQAVRVLNPSSQQSLPLTPLAVQSQRITAANFLSTPQTQISHTTESAGETTTPSKKAGHKAGHVIQPVIVRSGEDRHWALLLKLIRDFKEDIKNIISPMNLTTHNNDAKGIHVFVDASNIFIGFSDQLKRARGIPIWAKTPPVDLSFDALALLMERRRPVAKRVLAGSTPHLPAFDKAKAVGYECNILEKVHKAKELTERQVFFANQDRGLIRRGMKPPPHVGFSLIDTPPPKDTAQQASDAVDAAIQNILANPPDSGSGAETTPAPQFAPARLIEQGVDEILHLKILESIVDTDEPSTIVLATGDAAQAEYSQGFMAMVGRALKKGWKVELVSWSQNISKMYKRHEWTQAWGERFRVVELDDYAEELLDM